MLEIQRIVCNQLQENCYVVSDETRECVIIDCGAYDANERQAVTDYIRSHRLAPRHLLATHGHIDHNLGNDTIHREFGLSPEVHAADAEELRLLPQKAAELFGIRVDYDLPAPEHLVTDGEEIRFGSHRMTVIHTPGHSPGSVFYHCPEEHAAFSGDTLFRHCIGRTDFEGGSMFQMIQSLRTVCQLPDQTRIYPGHGGATTIGEELAENPYLDR